MPYLIDGHNLIPKLGLRLDSPDDEMELVAVLQEFCRLTRHQVDVYFDGAPAGQARTQKFGAVTVHFVRLGLTADSAILSRLKQLGRAARNWTVVSSDRVVQSGAHSVHAKVSSSDDLAIQLKKTHASETMNVGGRELSAQEVEEWLKLFRNKR